ncbi:MAG: circadian clock protein KaiC [Pseudomonadota bacterium]
MNPSLKRIDKRPTGIPGFDQVAQGGIPSGRTTLVSGTSGSAKTVFAGQFLYTGVTQFDENGVFVTFEESPIEIRRNLSSFGWDIESLEKEGKWAFVDSTPQFGSETVVAGYYDLGALLARVEHAIKKVGATRVAIDSIGPIFAQLPDAHTVRSELLRLAEVLRVMGVTTVMTAERSSDFGEVARHGVEEFVSDAVVILRNVLEDEKRRRTIEILKFRGAGHGKGEFPFTIVPETGIEVIPLSAIELTQRSSTTRIPSGVDELDDMCGGGFFRDSVILVSGATGTGKTLMVTEFLDGGTENGERSLLLAFEESRGQLVRNAQGWGVDFVSAEEDGLLKIECCYPEVMSLEDHLIRIKTILDEFKPQRVAVDSLSALERVSTVKGYREFVIGLTATIKERETAGLFTSTTPAITGGTSITEGHISTITDSIILLRYVEIFGEIRRAVAVLKMRGSHHDKVIREFTIDGDGMHLTKTFRNVTGILAGHPQSQSMDEIARIESMFES